MRKIRDCWEQKKKLCLYRGESFLNKVVNNWKVLQYHTTKEKPSGSTVEWMCECQLCGKQKALSVYNLMSGKSKSCSSCAMKLTRGDKNPNWKGMGAIPGSLISRAKHGAKSRGIDFDVDGKHLNEVWESQNHKCALTGIELSMRAISNTDDPWCNRASLDRKDSKLGYVRENVQWVHPIVNIMKNGFSQDKFVEICKLVAQKMSV